MQLPMESRSEEFPPPLAQQEPFPPAATNADELLLANLLSLGTAAVSSSPTTAASTIYSMLFQQQSPAVELFFPNGVGNVSPLEQSGTSELAMNSPQLQQQQAGTPAENAMTPMAATKGNTFFGDDFKLAKSESGEQHLLQYINKTSPSSQDNHVCELLNFKEKIYKNQGIGQRIGQLNKSIAHRFSLHQLQYHEDNRLAKGCEWKVGLQCVRPLLSVASGKRNNN